MESCGKYLNFYYLCCSDSDGTLYALIDCKISKGKLYNFFDKSSC